jgi:hypothetical protein
MSAYFATSILLVVFASLLTIIIADTEEEECTL